MKSFHLINISFNRWEDKSRQWINTHTTSVYVRFLCVDQRVPTLPKLFGVKVFNNYAGPVPGGCRVTVKLIIIDSNQSRKLDM